MQVIKARYPSECVICKKKHITPGMNIIQMDGGWAQEECWNKKYNAEVTEAVSTQVASTDQETADPAEEKELTEDEITKLKEQALALIYEYSVLGSTRYHYTSDNQTHRLQAKHEMQNILNKLGILPDDPNSTEELALKCHHEGIITKVPLQRLLGHEIEFDQDGKITDLHPK